MLLNYVFSSVWQKKVRKINRLAKGLLIIWMILVKQIADDLPNLQNFPPAKLSCYTLLNHYNSTNTVMV